MRLFDSHSHINHDEFDDAERAARIREIEEDPDLCYVMDIGCDMASSVLACEHAAKYPWCYGAVGFHPHDAKNFGPAEESLIRGMAKKPGICAIGEIGLDFHYDLSPRDEQRDCFRRQIRMANELKMPIVIHSREADGETMDILKEEGAFSEERKSWFAERPVPAGWESAAKDARERSGPDQILDPVVAVIEPGRLARHETIDLILREITVPLRRAKKFVGRKQF